MLELKKKAIGGIKEMLEGRLAKRMQPDREDKAEGPETGPPDAEDRAEGPEQPAEGSTADLQQDLPQGADLSKLSPEEQKQLEALYAKMGC